MKKVLSLFSTALIAVLTITSCNENNETYFDPLAQLELEKPIIKEYVTKNHPNAILDEKSGIWYEIIKAAETADYEYTVKDTLNQKWILAEAFINYTGRLVSTGTVFDKTKDVDLKEGTKLPIWTNFNTGNGSVIPAWLMAFYPKKIVLNEKEVDLGFIFANGAQAGDEFRIILPSYYGYGNRSNGAIPANSPLDFEIEVKRMRNYYPSEDNK